MHIATINRNLNTYTQRHTIYILDSGIDACDAAIGYDEAGNDGERDGEEKNGEPSDSAGLASSEASAGVFHEDNSLYM